MAIINYYKDIKIIRSIFRLNKHVFFNSFKRNDTWLRVLTIVLLVYILFHSIVSGGIAASLFKSFMHPGDKYYFPVINVSLFVLFVLNILASIYLSTSKYSEIIGTKLLYYPVSAFKIVLFGIFAATADLYNLFFVPFYAVTFLVIGYINSFTSFLLLLVIFCLFVMLTGSIIYLLKNLYLLIVSNQRQKKIFSYAGVALLLLIFIFPRETIGIFEKVRNILAVSKIVIYLPSGILANFVASTTGTITSKFLPAFVYFFLINILLFDLNRKIQKKLNRKKSIGCGTKFNKKQGRLVLFIKKHITNPVNKKDLIYSFRSTRELSNYLLLIYAYTLIAFYSFQMFFSHQIKGTDILYMSLFFIAFHLIVILKNCDNFFGYDYGGVINYFNKPLGYSNLLKYKTSSFNFLSKFNFVIGTICLIILQINILDYLLFISLLIITYFLLKHLGAVLSINHPYRISFYGLSGMNVSFVTMLIILITTLLFLVISYLLFKELSPFDKAIVSLIFLVVSFFLFKLNQKINSYLANLFVNKKEKIVSTCS